MPIHSYLRRLRAEDMRMLLTVLEGKPAGKQRTRAYALRRLERALGSSGRTLDAALLAEAGLRLAGRATGTDLDALAAACRGAEDALVDAGAAALAALGLEPARTADEAAGLLLGRSAGAA